MMASKQPSKPYWEMTTAELREATAEFDEEMVVDRSRPLNAAERAWWKKVQRSLRTTSNGRTITIMLDSGLLARCTALAKKKRISRDELIARGLKAVLAAEGK